MSAGVMLSAAGVYLAMQRALFFPSWADETVHVYVLQQLVAGHRLYGEIPSARPPLMFLLPFILSKLGLDSFLAARAAVALTVLGAALVVWRMGRKLGGPGLATVAAAAFLLSPDTAAFFPMTGIQQVALLTTLCLALQLEGKAVWAGIAGGLALASGQHALILVGLAGLVDLRAQRRRMLAYYGALAGAIAGVLLIARLWGGPAIWWSLIGQHLYHLTGGTAMGGAELGWFFGTWLLENLGWLSLAAVAVATGLGDWRVRMLAALAVVHILAVLMMSDGMILYLYPISPIVSLLAALGARELFERARKKLRRGRRSTFALPAVGLCVVGLLGLHFAAARHGERDSTSYSMWPQIRTVQIARARSLAVADRVAQAIGRDLEGDATIFGHPTLAAQVALRLHRRISAQLADFAPRRFLDDPELRRTVVDQIERDHLGLFVAQAGSFYFSDPFFQHYLDKCFSRPLEFPSQGEDGRLVPLVVVFAHLPGPSPCTPESP